MLGGVASTSRQSMMDRNCKYFIFIDAVIILTLLEWAVSKWYVPLLSVYKTIETIILLILLATLPFVKRKSKSPNRARIMSNRTIRIGKIIVYCFCTIGIVYFLRWLILAPFMSVMVQKSAFFVIEVLFSLFSLLIILFQCYYWRENYSRKNTRTR